jgi:hypothetical protein
MEGQTSPGTVIPNMANIQRICKTVSSCYYKLKRYFIQWNNSKAIIGYAEGAKELNIKHRARHRLKTVSNAK